jgi:hypothetical protein
MTDSYAVSMVEAVERYTQRQSFPPIDRIEMFFSSSSERDPLIGGQIVEVKRAGVDHEVEFAGMFTRLMEYKVTMEKRGNGWNIVCAPGVRNSSAANPKSDVGEIHIADDASNVPQAHGPAAALAAVTEPPPLVC